VPTILVRYTVIMKPSPFRCFVTIEINLFPIGGPERSPRLSVAFKSYFEKRLRFPKNKCYRITDRSPIRSKDSVNDKIREESYGYASSEID
jgi:hypothetical protein